jgi:glycine/serine hydroxymethyltransferase
VREAERRSAALRCRKVKLQMHQGNEATLAFYATLGYAEDRVVSLGEELA